VVVQVLLPGLVECVLLQDDVELAVQINLVPVRLEFIVDLNEVALLDHELLYIIDIFTE